MTDQSPYDRLSELLPNGADTLRYLADAMDNPMSPLRQRNDMQQLAERMTGALSDIGLCHTRQDALARVTQIFGDNAAAIERAMDPGGHPDPSPHWGWLCVADESDIREFAEQ